MFRIYAFTLDNIIMLLIHYFQIKLCYAYYVLSMKIIGWSLKSTVIFLVQC